MTVIDFETNQCKRIRAYLDSYINHELPAETTRAVLSHLEKCNGCADELEARLQVKQLLQSAGEGREREGCVEPRYVRARFSVEAADVGRGWRLPEMRDV